MAAALGTMPAMAVAPASAEPAAYWDLQPRAAFFEVYIHACQPVEYDFAGVRQELTKVAAWMYEELFVKEYAGSCRDFYFGEVVQRIVPTQLRPLFAKL